MINEISRSASTLLWHVPLQIAFAAGTMKGSYRDYTSEAETFCRVLTSAAQTVTFEARAHWKIIVNHLNDNVFPFHSRQSSRGDDKNCFLTRLPLLEIN
jgi:hypothetical protein